ncbi:hypothetical protein JUNP712_3777 [Acinetobacter baumannii]
MPVTGNDVLKAVSVTVAITITQNVKLVKLKPFEGYASIKIGEFLIYDLLM